MGPIRTLALLWDKKTVLTYPINKTASEYEKQMGSRTVWVGSPTGKRRYGRWVMLTKDAIWIRWGGRWKYLTMKGGRIAMEPVLTSNFAKAQYLTVDDLVSSIRNPKEKPKRYGAAPELPDEESSSNDFN